MRERRQPTPSPPGMKHRFARLPSSRAGGGQPLPAEHKAFFEPLFGRDFSRVRVHADREASTETRRLGARAYTRGADIFWNDREPPVETPAARRLLAHELAHTVQQGAFSGNGSSSRDGLEADADTAATAVLSGRRAELTTTASPDLALCQQGAFPPLPELRLPPLGDSRFRPRFETTRTEWTLENFDTGEHALNPDHRPALDAIVRELTERPLGYGEYVTIWGATDRRGTESYNQELGQRRADEVRRAILARVPNPELAPEVRAYSIGETTAARAGDVSVYRSVTVTISRRAYRGEPLLPPLLPPGWRAERPPVDLNLRRDYFPMPGPDTLPPDFWNLPPVPLPRDVQQEVVRGLSRALGEALHADELARLGGRFAGMLGMDEREATRRLRELAQQGGEAAVRGALRALIEAAAGPPTAVSPGN